ncbi:MAG: sulfatase [Terriglobia bacterium]|nr:MAG: sulfatase [Terriglobia bacterium]
MDRREFLSAMAAAAGRQALAAAPKPPNIVLILADDLGYGDLGCYGSSIRTPNLDRLASEGVRFTNCDSADPVCSPSRAALLTGRYPTRVGVPRVFFPQDQDGLNLDETTLADVLRARKYSTMCIGKWHLGRPAQFLPTARGFQEYFGIPYSNDMNPRVLMHNTEVIQETADLDALTMRYTEQAVKFINTNKTSPFFLYMPHTYPHIPLGASQRFRGKSAQGIYGDVVEELDWSVGEVLHTLKQNKLDQDTMVIFTSDNGPWYLGSPGKLRGRKATTYEGGVREPFLARWTGKIPGGRTCDGTASLMDVFPTVARLCDAALPAKSLDGVDIWPLLQGRMQSVERPPLLYFDEWELQCVRWKNWKLHLARYNTPPYVEVPARGRHTFTLPRPELYNLVRDPDESYDVAAENSEVVKDLLEQVAKMVPTFPPPVQEAFAATQKRRANPITPTGAYPYPDAVR